MQHFYINKDATLPKLRMELVNDGRYEYLKSANFNNAIQDADVYFSMWNEHDVLCISKQKCELVLVDEGTCDERYVIEYSWKPRDTRNTGHFKGKITIDFIGDITEKANDYDSGVFIGPIHEDLEICIK